MVDHVAAQTLVTIVAVSVVLGSIGFVLTPWLLQLMGVAADVYRNALVFLRITFIALPFLFVYAMVQALMRGAGEVKAPLYIVAVTVAINFALDPLLIFGKFGSPALGVAGAAIATLIAQAIAAVVGLRLLFGGRYGIHVHWHDFVPDFAFVKRAFLLGYPASIEQSARGLGMAVLTFLITSFGTVVTASFGVGVNLFNVMLIPAMGFSMATSTLVGQNIGAGNVPRAEKVAKLAGMITFSVLTTLGILCVLVAPVIVRFFVPEDPRVIAEGAVYIRVVAWSFGFIGLQFALMGVLRAAGEMIPAMIISLVSQWVLQIPLAYLLSRQFGMGADGIWWSTPIANVVTAAIATTWFARGTWKARRLIGQSPIRVQQEKVELEAQME